jgi:dTDP-4-dehydrorhamnose 3,5-epimerase
MHFRSMLLAGAVVIEPELAIDERGSVCSALRCRGAFCAHSLPTEYAQTSVSYNRRRGTLRGLHYQVEPFAEAKLVRCTAGLMFDVIVDVRTGSQSFGHWHSVELSTTNRLTLHTSRFYSRLPHAHG